MVSVFFVNENTKVIVLFLTAVQAGSSNSRANPYSGDYTTKVVNFTEAFTVSS